MDQYNNQDQYGYVQQSSGGIFESFSSGKRVNALEIGLIIISILGLIGIFWWGFANQGAINRDKQRFADISNVSDALDEFYKNSSLVPSQRFYPKAPCSESLNEVDFEYTMRNYLTGRVPEVESHIYIDSQKFPKDNWGEYSQTFGQRKVPYRCTQNLGSDTLSSDSLVYSDKSPSCNFSKKLGYQKCYLYTSSNNGDTYQLGYFKEETSKFVIYSKFRDDRIKVASE
jgi:hypothetical protein